MYLCEYSIHKNYNIFAESTSDCQNSKESEGKWYLNLGHAFILCVIDGADDGELVLLEGPRERTTSSIRRLSNDGIDIIATEEF